ncbi:hypothetical protein JCM10908_006638 [Rhodotorula pacifica]|uniref:uncharacterized protein n=1 Tax=Rhodotorula pacifica TaxID=1495444 RepID=UPI00317301F8
MSLHAHSAHLGLPGFQGAAPVDTASDSDEDILPEPVYPQQGTYREKIEYLYDKALRRINRLEFDACRQAQAQANVVISAAEAWRRQVLAPEFEEKVASAQHSQVKLELRKLCIAIKSMEPSTALHWPVEELIKYAATRTQPPLDFESRVGEVIDTVRAKMETLLCPVTTRVTGHANRHRQEAERWRTKMLNQENRYAAQSAMIKARVEVNFQMFEDPLAGMTLTQLHKWPVEHLGAHPGRYMANAFQQPTYADSGFMHGHAPGNYPLPQHSAVEPAGYRGHVDSTGFASMPAWNAVPVCGIRAGATVWSSAAKPHSHAHAGGVGTHSTFSPYPVADRHMWSVLQPVFEQGVQPFPPPPPPSSQG